ncbi:MAG: ATP-binding protein, partial [Bacteroidota bacterium]|nr:ATP-binding protein [Bacteroidota bacterium]
GTVTVLLNVRQFETKYKQEIIEKVQEINISLQQKYSDIDDFSEIEPNVLSSEMRKFAEVFGIDINLYNNDGFLISTSRPEIYYLDIIGKRMSAFAHYKIKYNTIVKFILNEEISELKYNSAYALISEDLNHKAVVNMPYFINPESLRLEISNLLVSIINIYVVLFVIALILSVFTSEQIISPLIILQNKFKKLEIGKIHEKIEYKRKDEIGQLVSEYNNMVDKLQESIEKLSKTERESAWRDMAKQIAHEIKNPLTPMKLSIQLLMRSWENQDSDFDIRLNDVSNTLITQIETLRRIAEEFSDFAKMPKSQKQVINLGNKVEEVCKLYENTENLEVSLMMKNYKDVFIVADERQLSRALINLIKNGIQSIPEGVKGLIRIEMDVFGKKAILKIIDNGSGISDEIKDKLFTPSFTTKSSGMGLGLAMVKNIVDNAEGKISFESKQGKGTTFILEFPLHDESEEKNI